MLYALDQTIPVISNVNDEYKNIAREDDEKTDEVMLQMMIESQISSIRGMKDIEESKSIEEATKKVPRICKNECSYYERYIK